MKLLRCLSSTRNYPTRKYVFEDGNKTADAVYVNRYKKHIICLSSMYGCPVKCAFCASGSTFFGTMKTEEILDIALTIAKKESIKPAKKTLFSFMGCGDPMLNIINVRESIKQLNELVPNSYFSLSVSGAKTENLQALAGDSQIQKIRPKLQISLHSPYDEQRRTLIPATDPLYKVLSNIHTYAGFLGLNIEANYVLLDGINDTKQHAIDLAMLIKGNSFSLKINEYHDVGKGFKESRNKNQFLEWLIGEGLPFETYSTDGYDIGAACGQLVSLKLP